MKARLPLFACFAIALTPGRAQLTYQLGNTLLDIDVVVDSDRVNIPWEILWGPDDRLWMTDGPLITRWDPMTDVVDTLLDRGHGNGLGMVLHPDFPNTPIVIAVFDTNVYYSGASQLCEVLRLTYDAVNDVIGDEEVLFSYWHPGEHSGGRVLFDTTGNVLLTTAEYQSPDTLFSTRGKTLRFATDGSVPPDNPRADYTWTWGHRNPQGLAMLPNGAVVNSEHGWNSGDDEINLIRPNEVDGFPYYEGNTCHPWYIDTCNSPTYSYTPALAVFHAPPSGCEFYDNPAIPELDHRLITCCLSPTGLMLFEFNIELDSIVGLQYLHGGAFNDMVRNRDIAIRPDGSFYLITNDRANARIRWVHPDTGTNTDELFSTHRDLSAWPNPASDRITVSVPNAARSTRVDLHDLSGRWIAPAQRMGERFLFDVQDLAPGIYVAHVSDGRTVRVSKR